MTVGELKEALEDYGDHLSVIFTLPNEKTYSVNVVEPATIDGMAGVTLAH